MMDQTKTVTIDRAPPAPMQLYAVLDNNPGDEYCSGRQEYACTQFVMPQTDTLANAMHFLNDNIAQPLWGVSHVDLVGIVSLDALLDNGEQMVPRKVLTNFPLNRIFVPGHSDCLVVVSTQQGNRHDDADEIHTDDSTDYPTSATGRFITDILDEDDDDHDASHDDSSTCTSNDGDEATDHDNGVITTDDDDEDELNTLPRHLLTAAGASMVSIADTEAESTTPLTGLERATSTTGDDETTEAAASPSSSTEVAAISNAEQQRNDVTAITPNKEQEPKKASGTSADTPTKMATDGISNMNENSGNAAATLNSPGASEKASEGRATGYSRGNSIGLSYDVPIESESDGTETGNSSKQDDLNESPNTGNVAAGVAVAGVIAAGVVANGNADEEPEHMSPTKPHNETTISDITEGTMPIPQVVKSNEIADVVSPLATDRDVSTPERSGGGGVAALISMFDKHDEPVDADDSSTESHEIPTSNEKLVDAHAMNIQDRGEQVHLLGGFTTEEESENDDLFRPDIPQNLKTDSGRKVKGGDSQYDGIEEYESVQTMEFPASDDDMPTACSSFDNVVVVDLPEETSVSTGSNADPQMSGKNTDKREEHLVSTSNDVIVGAEAKESQTKAMEIESNPTSTNDIGTAEDVPTETKRGMDTVPVMSDATSASKTASDATDPDNFDSWRTDDTQDEEGSSSFFPATEEAAPKKNNENPTDVPMTFPSLLGTGTGVDWDNNSDTEGEPLLPDRKEESDTAAPRSGPKSSTEQSAAPEISYKIGSTYFLLRERDGVEYPVKILSLGKRGTCIVEYEHHRAKKNIRTSSLLPDTPARRQKFDEQMNSGEIATDLPARISKELKQKQTERHARHEERRKYGHHISRSDLPTCSTAGTVLDFKTRRVYFAKDKETVREISKKFNVSSDRIVYDNKVAFPSLKKSSKLRPLTCIVLPPA